MNVVALLVFAVPALAGVGWTLLSQNPAWAVAGAAIGLVLAQAP